MKSLFPEFEQQNSSTLIIIGNGFDLASGIESSYGDFKLWLKQKGKQDLINLMNKFFSNQRDVWGDIEKALGEYDEDDILDFCKPDEEIDYDHQMRSVARIEDAPDAIFQPVLNEFAENFKDWVNGINFKAAKKIFDLPLESRYLTFNYTETLEKLYGIADSNILHIHGSRLSNGDDYIIGHSNLRNPRDAFENISELYFLQHTREKIIKWMNGWVKDTVAIIGRNKEFFNGLSDIKQVFVYGLSFYEVDWPYLEEVVKQTGEDIPWLISYHTDEDWERIESFILKSQLNHVRRRYL